MSDQKSTDGNDQMVTDAESQKNDPTTSTSSETSKPNETPTQPITREPEYLSGVRLWSLFFSTTTVGFLLMLDSSIVSTAIPHLTSEFHSLLDVGWYGTAYQLANASFQPLAGTLYTHLNSKWTFMSFVAVFELGSLLCGVANSSKMLIVGRAIEGLGGSGLQNGMFIIMSGCVPMEKRPALMGLGMGVSQIGLVIGPVIGGVLTEYATWRWCFYINLPIGGVALLLFLLCHVPESRPVKTGLTAVHTLRQKLDVFGFLFFAGSAIQLLLALQFGGNQHPWNSSRVIGLFCGAAGTLVVFAFVEHYRGQGAMIPLQLIQKRFIYCGFLVMLFSVTTTFCASYYLPIYFQAVKEASPSLSGVYLLPTIISQVIFIVISGSILQRTGHYLPFAVLGAILTSIGSGLISTYTPHTSTGQWIGYQIILGAGRGFIMQMPIIAIQGLLPRSQIAIGTAFLMLGHTFGGAISLSIAQTIFNNSLKAKLPSYAPGVDTSAVIAAGATAFRTVVSPDEVGGVLRAYSKVVDGVFYYTAASAACSFFAALGLGWNDVRKQPGKEEKE